MTAEGEMKGWRVRGGDEGKGKEERMRFEELVTWLYNSHN
jgi:hypothetical protein